MTQKLLLNVNEVASVLGCGRTYVYGMIQRGELPVVKLGRLTRIPASSVADMVTRAMSFSEVDRSPWADAQSNPPGCASTRVMVADTVRRSRLGKP